MFTRNVRVRFLSADGGPLIGEAEFAAEQLPESFEARTTLELGGQSWEVIKAEPMTRSEYARTRRLTIVMRKIEVQRVARRDILYSLPTINDSLPSIATGSTKLGKKVLELHADDWRQIEFVSRELSVAIADELAHVRRVLDSRTGSGFKEIHVRRQLPTPMIERHVKLSALTRALPAADDFDALAFRDIAGIVADGFALDGGDIRVYGISADGLISIFAIQRALSASLLPFAEVASDHDLLLVDWCAAQIIDL